LTIWENNGDFENFPDGTLKGRIPMPLILSQAILKDSKLD
jgi:hypothetical protein